MRMPITISLNITNNCNLKCRHCSANSLSKKNNILSMNKINFLSDLFKKMKLFSIEITGGEPFSSPYLYDFVSSLYDWQLVRIRTNATLISKEMLHKLRTSNLFFVVSIDGDEQTHNFIRGAGAYKKSLQGIQFLLQAGYPVGIVYTIMNSNYRTIYKSIRYLSELGIKEFSISNCHDVGRARSNSEIIGLEQYLQFKDQLEDIKNIQGIKVSGDFPSLSSSGNTRIHNCSAAIDSCTILENGDVVPCNSMHNYVCGNIFEEDFNKIWNESKKIKKFRDLKDIQTAQLSCCSTCELNSHCSAGCRADSYAENKDLYSKSQLHCNFVKWGVKHGM